MFELNEYIVNVPRHTDATATIWVVPFDINTRKFITGHVVRLHEIS